MRALTIPIALAFVAASGACISGMKPVTGAAVRYPAQQATLKSGLRTAYELAPQFGTAGFVLSVETGSSADPAGKEGLAHLLEHLVFQARHGGDTTFWDQLHALGAGEFNAWTNWDSTSYYAFGPTQALDGLLSLYASILDDPLAGVDAAAFEHERHIVLDELRSRAENGTPSEAEGLLSASIFAAGHDYARPVIGTEASIAALTLDDAKAF